MQITGLKANILLSTDSGSDLNFHLIAPNKKLGTVSESADALALAFVAAFGEICGIKYDGGEKVAKLEKEVEKLTKQVEKLPPKPEPKPAPKLVAEPKPKELKTIKAPSKSKE